ncbi:MAG: aminoacyl-tRNA hydrolase [Oscillibacter sp.]|nr:aminoacyl-tRNA hydrolase [Oscillibacter sp.]
MLFGNASSGVEWIVAGLGNPGEQYAHTRHNMGFLTVDLLAEQNKVKLNRVKFKSAYNILQFAGAKCLVMKPQTYMNLSGEAVGEASRFYRVEPSHVLVIFDDISLPVGKIRVRPSGSAGGHNGIKSVIAHLGTQDFPRVKIGTGAPEAGGDMIRWVTGEPPMKDREILLDAFGRAIQAAECVVRHGCQRAMNDFNG